jgi:hypothetical protein
LVIETVEITTMLTEHESNVARRGQKIYDQRLKAELELKHPNAYVAIEPDSGDYFVGSSIAEADDAAQEKYPGRLTYVLRIGHEVVFHMGAVL